jgi:hypothetical protein
MAQVQSWNIKKFHEDFGAEETARVLGLTNYRSIYPAMERGIRIVLTEDGHYETHEAKLLNRVRVEA